MDNNSSTMQDDMQLSQPVNQTAAGSSKQNRPPRPPSKIVENAYFCYSLPNAESTPAPPNASVSIEESLAHFPKTFEAFLKAASSLPLKFRGWWKVRVSKNPLRNDAGAVLVFSWLQSTLNIF
jgi:hypothetical protein